MNIKRSASLPNIYRSVTSDTNTRLQQPRRLSLPNTYPSQQPTLSIHTNHTPSSFSLMQRDIRSLSSQEYSYIQQCYTTVINSLEHSKQEIEKISSSPLRRTPRERNQIKVLERQPLHDLRNDIQYPNLQKLFAISNISDINTAYHGNITLQVKKEDSPQTLMISHIQPSYIPDKLYYWELPAIPTLTFNQSGIIGGYKEIIKVPYKGKTIVLAKDHILNTTEQARNERLTQMQNGIHRAIELNILGAELISIPYVVAIENNSTILVQSLTGEKDLQELAHKELNEGIQRISIWKKRIRDMYMANKVLASLGYYNCDTKLENAVLLSNGRVATIDIDMLATQSIPPIYTYSMLDPIWDICSRYINTESDNTTSIQSLFFSLVNPLVLLRELDSAVHRGKPHLFTLDELRKQLEQKTQEKLSFILCENPSVFLSTLKQIYAKTNDNYNVTRISALEEKLKDIELEKNPSRIISHRIVISELFSKEDINNIALHHDIFQKEASTHILSQQAFTFRLHEHVSEDIRDMITDYLQNLFTTPQAIQSQINEVRTTLHIFPHTASDEELKTYLIAMYNIKNAIPHQPTQEDIKRLAHTLDKTIANILNVKQYQKADNTPIYTTLHVDKK